MTPFRYRSVAPDAVSVYLRGALIGVLHRVSHSRWMVDGFSSRTYGSRAAAAWAAVAA